MGGFEASVGFRAQAVSGAWGSASVSDGAECQVPTWEVELIGNAFCGSDAVFKSSAASAKNIELTLARRGTHSPVGRARMRVKMAT